MVPRRWPVHIAGLWTIAVVQPLVDLVARSPEFLVAHAAGPPEILLLVGVLVIVLPLPLLAAVALARLGGIRAQAGILGFILSGLAGIVAVQVAKQLGVTTWPAAAAAAVVVGLATVLLYFRFPGVRTFFTVLAAGIVIVPAAFVLRPGVTKLIVPAGDGSRAEADPRGHDFLPAPVVFIVFDELPLVALLSAHHDIDAAVYPNFSALARDGIWFRNATTVSDYTRWALPAILSGRYPQGSQLPTPGDHPNTLISWFSRTHRLEVFESATDLCPPDLCARPRDTLAQGTASLAGDLAIVAAHLVLTPDLQERWELPDLSARWGAFGGRETAERGNAPVWRWRWRERPDHSRELALRFVDGIEASDPQPTFYFLHPLLPHQPWGMLPGGRRNSSLAPLPKSMQAIAGNDEWEIAQNQQRQLLQVGYVDHVVGRVIAKLEDIGLYDRALVVVTADHGFAITSPYHVRKFSPGNAAEIMRVPLIIKFPEGVDLPPVPLAVTAAGHRVSDRNVETVDIAPTVAHALGVPIPWQTDGASLLDPSKPPRREKRIWFDAVRQMQQYDAKGPPLDEVLRRRSDVFGAANVYRVPRPARHGDLVGRRVADCPVVDTPLTADLRFAWQYRDFDPDGHAVPFDVSGELNGRDAGAGPAYLAVAVNGVIEAVTRTWTSRSGWLATPPLDVWRRGSNSVEVYVIEERAGGTTLGRVASTSRPEDLNLISGTAAQFWNVRQQGFYKHERKGDDTFRWTRGTALVTMPLLGRTPASVQLRIVRAARRSIRLRITANDCVLHDGAVGRDWNVTLPLAPCRIEGDELTIALASETARPRGGKDRRRLGVAVGRITVQMTGEEADARP